MIDRDVTRRTFLAGVVTVAATGGLSGCLTDSSGQRKESGGPVSVYSDLSSPQAKAAMQAVVDAFNKRGGSKASLNTIAAETFRTQLPTYLTSSNPPDIYTEGAGSVASSYAAKGLLLDLSDVWKAMGDYSPALKKLSTDKSGKQIFVPTNYYWWAVFYRKSNFAKWGVSAPNSWDEFLRLCQSLQGKGVAPIGLGAGGTPWVASAWFDYLDVRINGAQFHRDLLIGKHSFNSPQVRKVFATWKAALPYFDPNGTSLPFQEATSQLLQGRTGMMLIGTFFADAAPKDALDDIDFFRFPIIDPKVPTVEEAPTDGFFASSRSSHVTGTKEFLTYMATADAQNLLIKSSSGTSLPANPKAQDLGTPLVTKGKKMLAAAADLTQFFNRDSSDALQPTADTALIRFLSKPNELDAILGDWEKEAQQVRRG